MLAAAALSIIGLAAGAVSCRRGESAAAAAAASPSPPLPPPPAAIAARVRLERVATGLDRPVALIAQPADSSGRLFVAEQTGRVRVVRPAGAVDREPFIDLSARVTQGVAGESEQGLLGIAFHPSFSDANDRRVFANFTGRDGHTRVLEWRVPRSAAAPGAGERPDPASERQILYVEQPYRNHNGGHLAFGPDGRLYVGLGDGGSAGDPKGNGQNPRAWLGKMLRMDVGGSGGNPPAPEIVALGLRNPWRYSFDRATGDLYIADVGQYLYEEINVVPAASIVATPVRNFGWAIVEGMGHCYGRDGCRQDGLILPAAEYTHAAGCSVTGGFVYRGKALPDLEGRYFYADYCTAIIRSFRFKEGRAADHWEWRGVLDPDTRLSRLSSFGEDGSGELYLMSLEGSVYRFARR